jgi:hypothetical protein
MKTRINICIEVSNGNWVPNYIDTMSHNRFLSFANDTSTTSNSSFIISAASNIQSIDINTTDEFIELPNPDVVKWDVIQYRKLISTNRDIIFTYAGLQIGKLHFHRKQTIVFHRFKSLQGSNWI